MAKPVITLAMLAELVEAARIVYIKGDTATPNEAERLNEALAPVSWRVRELQAAIPVEIKEAADA